MVRNERETEDGEEKKKEREREGKHFNGGPELMPPCHHGDLMTLKGKLRSLARVFSRLRGKLRGTAERTISLINAVLAARLEAEPLLGRFFHVPHPRAAWPVILIRRVFPRTSILACLSFISLANDSRRTRRKIKATTARQLHRARPLKRFNYRAKAGRKFP